MVGIVCFKVNTGKIEDLQTGIFLRTEPQKKREKITWSYVTISVKENCLDSLFGIKYFLYINRHASDQGFPFRTFFRTSIIYVIRSSITIVWRRQMNSNTRRITSVLLSLLMCFNNLILPVYAEGEETPIPVEEPAAEVIQGTEEEREPEALSSETEENDSEATETLDDTFTYEEEEFTGTETGEDTEESEIPESEEVIDIESAEEGTDLLGATPESAFEYSVGVNNEVTITGYTGTDTEVEIPSEIEGHPVTTIGREAFSGCISLTSIELPNGITSIGDYAFSDCISLTSIELPDGLTSIGDSAFYRCTDLTSINIPASVTSIGDRAFWNCSSLTTIELPNGITSIGDSAFSACTSLTSIELPDAVTSIGDAAFYGCRSLTSIELPASVTSIGSAAFFGCSGLTTIELPDAVTSIGDYAFYGCGSLTSIELPAGITSIESRTFTYCSSLNSIKFSDSVTSIKDSAFKGCESLTDVYYNGTQTQWNAIAKGSDNDPLTSAALHTIDSDFTYTIKNDKATITKYIGTDTEVEIPSEIEGHPVTTIGPEAFYNCIDLTSITIPSSVTSIEDYAFFGCSSLTSIELPDSVTSMGYSAFEDCTNLKTAGPIGSGSNIEFGWTSSIPSNAFWRIFGSNPSMR